jgi:hypothetical protein
VVEARVALMNQSLAWNHCSREFFFPNIAIHVF